MSSTSSQQHSRSSLSSIFSKQSSITTDDGAAFGAWAQHNYYDLPEEPINFPMSNRPPRKESSSSVSSSSLSSTEQFDNAYSRRRECFEEKSSFESSLSSTSNFAIPAEDVLMNLGFGSTPNILPERFAKEWYEKMMKTRMRKLEEAKRRRGQYANQKQKSLPVHEEEDEKKELETIPKVSKIEKILEEKEVETKVDDGKKLVSLPSIVVNEKPTIVQQSSSSLEVAEIFRSDDKQPPSRRLSIRSNEDRLCPPSPSAYGLSPNALSPVTVIEMDQLDNINDTEQPGELSAISEEELIYTITSQITNQKENIAERRSAFTSTNSADPEGKIETNLIMFTQDVAIQEDDGRISPIIMRPTPYFEEDDQFCIVMDKSTQTVMPSNECKEVQTNKVHKLCIGTQTAHNWQNGEDNSAEFESFVILSSVAVQTEETLTRYKSSKSLRQFNHTLDRLADKARSINEQKIDVSAVKTQWWFDQLLSPSIERKTLSEYLTNEKEDVVSS
ncbi:unnamed protein product [Dimorphilus gyrociliatus]|uniref:Uncharacterized protein n=1 Tax=Dimorphilus gyrociliatus TaxID=2664684 RepID=A0A7I8VU06_9ANNE|nr:unnamed protein product [Dimorphilus gyrociliatus]